MSLGLIWFDGLYECLDRTAETEYFDLGPESLFWKAASRAHPPIDPFPSPHSPGKIKTAPNIIGIPWFGWWTPKMRVHLNCLGSTFKSHHYQMYPYYCIEVSEIQKVSGNSYRSYWWGLPCHIFAYKHFNMWIKKRPRCESLEWWLRLGQLYIEIALLSDIDSFHNLVRYTCTLW